MGLSWWALQRPVWSFSCVCMYIEMWEFDSLTELETNTDRIFANEGMKKIGKGFHLVVDQQRSPVAYGVQ